MTATTTDARRYRLPGETRVLNTRDGEPGTILNGFAFDTRRGWTEYEVSCAYGIEPERRRFDSVRQTGLSGDGLRIPPCTGPSTNSIILSKPRLMFGRSRGN